MTHSKLNTPASIFVSRIHSTAIAFALLLLAPVFLTQTAAAQEGVSPRPVARLMSDAGSDIGHARARRVNPAGTHPADAAPELSDANPIERRAFEETNQARLKNGLEPLTWDGELFRLARAHSEQMALQKFFAHETPGGLQLKDRARANQIRFRVIGENIAYNKGYDDPGGFAVERWMISSGHRANILYAGFQSAAIGSYVAADGSTYLTQVFITR